MFLKPRRDGDDAPRLSDLEAEVNKILLEKGLDDLGQLKFELPVYKIYEVTEVDKKTCRNSGLTNLQCRVDGIWGKRDGDHCLRTIGLHDEAVLYVDGIGDDIRLYQSSGKRHAPLSTNVKLPWFIALEGHAVVRVTQRTKEEQQVKPANLQLRVKTMTGMVITLDVQPFETVEYAKQIIQDRIGVPTGQQRLILTASSSKTTAFWRSTTFTGVRSCT